MFFEDDVLSTKDLTHSTSARGLDKKMLFVASHNMLTPQDHSLQRRGLKPWLQITSETVRIAIREFLQGSKRGDFPYQPRDSCAVDKRPFVCSTNICSIALCGDAAGSCLGFKALSHHKITIGGENCTPKSTSRQRGSIKMLWKLRLATAGPRTLG